MRVLQFIAVTWLALMYAFAPAHAEKRVALVIGNDRYTNLPGQQLRKAVSDARAVGGALRQIGFEVIAGENLGRSALVDKLDELTRRLSPGDTAFFFFSGHGVALDGVNFILPSDVPDIASGQETRLKLAALGETDIIAGLTDRSVRVAVVVLDACRNNPFKPTRPGLKGVGIEKGLAQPPQVRGVFSLYAAGIGQSALDQLYDGDSNPDSVFSRVLVPALTQPGRDLTALAVDVRQEVARIAQGAGFDQQPAYYDGLTGRFYLAGLPAANMDGGGGGASPPARPENEVAWSYVRDTKDAGQLRRFVAQFPASPHRGEAEERLKALEQTNLAMTLPARPGDMSKRSSDPCGGMATASPTAGCGAPLTAAQERGLKPKDTFRECENCPEMVVVPAGSFTMGSPEWERDRDNNEGPQHVVAIAKPFAVGKFHVTVDQYAAFVQETGYQATSKCYDGKSSSRSWRDPGWPQESAHPVVCVTWDDAKAYVDWMAKETRKPYRLLSEAEFEYAARGRTSPGAYPRFWFGNDEKELCRYGNGADQKTQDSGAMIKPIAPCNDGYALMSPAGHYRPNAFGLYDMFGNAWQWTADCYHDSYNGAPADGSAWTAGACSSGRVIRGGSSVDGPPTLRSAIRLWLGTGVLTGGFRVARTLTR